MPPSPCRWWHWGKLGRVGHTDPRGTGGSGVARSPPFRSDMLAQEGCLHREGKFIAPMVKDNTGNKNQGRRVWVQASRTPSSRRGETHEHNRAHFGGAKISKHPLGDRKDSPTSRFSRGSKRGGRVPGAAGGGETLRRLLPGEGGTQALPSPWGAGDRHPSRDCTPGRGGSGSSQGGSPGFTAEEGGVAAKGRVPPRKTPRGGAGARPSGGALCAALKAARGGARAAVRCAQLVVVTCPPRSDPPPARSSPFPPRPCSAPRRHG